MKSFRWIEYVLVVLAGALVGGAVMWVWSAPPGADSSVSRARVSRGEPIEDFALPDLTGGSTSLLAYAAGRPFVISFGQTTCPPCVMQSRVFGELHKHYGDRVAIVKIYAGEPREAVARQVEQLRSTTKTLLDRDGGVFLRFGTGAIPVTVVGDGQGRVVRVGSFMPLDELVGLFDGLLKDAPASPAA